MNYSLYYYCSLALLLCAFPAKNGISQNNLDGYISMAIEANPELQSVYYEYLSVAERVNQSGSIPDPTLTMAYGLSPVETRLGAQEAKFTVSQMFPWFGTSKSKKEAYTHIAEAKKEKFIASKNKVILDVKIAWYALYENNKRTQYTQQIMAILDMLEEVVISRYENNKAEMVSVLQIQMEKDELADKLLQFEEERRTLLTQFNLLLNAPVDHEVVLPDTLYPLQSPDLFILDTILANNPNIRALQARHSGSEEMVRLSKLNGSPSFGIGLDYSVISKRTDMDVPDNGRDVIMPMASLKLPIYRKKYKSAIVENTIISEGIKYNINQVENKIRLDYQKSRENYYDASRKTDLYVSQMKKADQALQLLLTESATGNLQFDNILKMQQLLIKYSLLFEKANAKKLSAIATLEYLVAKN